MTKNNNFTSKHTKLVKERSVHSEDDDSDDDDEKGSQRKSSCTSTYRLTDSDSTSATESSSLTRNIGKNNKRVTCSRYLVILALISSTLCLSFLTHQYVLYQQKQDFHDEFLGMAHEIIGTSQKNALNVFNALDTLSVTTTSYALSTNAIWPYVTIPNFEQLAKSAMRSSHALIIAELPIVDEKDEYMWEAYSVKKQNWIQESHSMIAPNDAYKKIEPIPDHVWHNKISTSDEDDYDDDEEEIIDADIIVTGEGQSDKHSNRVLKSSANDNTEGLAMIPEERGSGPYSPVWHISPPPPVNNTKIINYNLLRKQLYKQAVEFINFTRKPIFLDICNNKDNWFQAEEEETVDVEDESQKTVVIQPIFSDFTNSSTIVGHFVAVIPWESFFSNILHPTGQAIIVVLENACSDEAFSFEIKGYKVTFLGEANIHNKDYESLKITQTFAEFSSNNNELLLESNDLLLSEDICILNISVYPTKALYDVYVDNDPLIYGVSVISIFLITSAIFLVYDTFVRRRQMKLIADTAEMHRSLITSLFPANVRERVIEAVAEGNKHSGGHEDDEFLNEGSESVDNWLESKPICDLYPEVTIMFADISGFTVWSSARGPEQVFTLLEIVYHSFDLYAKKRNVFKVESIGDCYVAASGVPDYRKDHAIIMSRFVHGCLDRFNSAVQKLEYVLGPETADLKLRCGLHTGPVTAGVLRGEKARFQLFGDTVNTAAVMESTGKPNKIHLSREMAEVLMDSGKKHWVEPREDSINVKGKGLIKTYWLHVRPAASCAGSSSDSRSMAHSSEHSQSSGEDEIEFHFNMLVNKSTDCYHFNGFSDKTKKLINWNCAVLIPHLRNIIARRNASKLNPSSAKKIAALEGYFVSKAIVADEVQEVIELPEFAKNSSEAQAVSQVVLSDEVELQLRKYITLLASMYEDNPFHSFEHASHVTMSASKLLSRIIAPTRDTTSDKSLHDHTYGITSDPLTQFAVILAALMHDAGHKGVPNGVLIKEDPALAERYQNKSIAEQNSVDIAWKALMSGEFEALRNCIYCNEAELKRFRQLIVNCIMATDIFDKDLGKIRKERWDKAFSDETSGDNTQLSVNRKATIVIEHLIQASDVAHTMQHFVLYQKWNAKFFDETYQGYLAGRTDKDPSDGWYKGEIWFFDYYIIPLAKKLSVCGVFGASSDEYLNYARANRREWEVKGKEIVAELKKQYEKNENNDALFGVA